MIEKNDIEIFLKAKKDQLAIDILQVLSALTMGALITLEAFEIGHDYTIILATCSFFFLAATAGSRWVSVSRGALIDLIGRAINSDADALNKLAAVKKPSSKLLDISKEI